jgi:pSer/pThr/pTyr-binding forkhead associated (FHA) protein
MSVKQYTIGRDDECLIRIQDNTQRVSRSHATLKVSGNGKMFIADHSSNGTFVNGVKIASNIDFPVKRGDTISFANTVELNWKLIPKTRNKLLLYSLIAVVIIAAGAFIFYLSSNRCIPKQEEEITLPSDSLEYAKHDSVDQDNKYNNFN